MKTYIVIDYYLIERISLYFFNILAGILPKNKGAITLSFATIYKHFI
ncbi:hypothetical protein ATE84_1356 [Aquimarina sp. MAR_2010_214]|nr:hypothetical protein ATE84_1356 [Aquimarina sp. MAR_2010_214]